ncbi:MAG TPA: hypothetical protein VGE30_00105 [Candidatus Saccharimonadales bacterium]
MATAVMTPDEPRGHSAPQRPIVLALNCDRASQYLIENEVLMCLGLNLMRIDVNIDARLTSVGDATASVKDLAEVYENEPFKNLRRFVRDPGWLAEQVHENIITAVQKTSYAFDYDGERVKVVLVSQDLLGGDGNVMEGTLPWLYSKAAFFSIGPQPDKRPRRIWTTPIHRPEVGGQPVPTCFTCGTPMRPAGSCYVCEGCGSTRGCG